MKRVLNIVLGTILFSGVALAETLPPHTAKIGEGVYSFGNPANAYFSMFVVTNEGVIAIESVNYEPCTGHGQGHQGCHGTSLFGISCTATITGIMQVADKCFMTPARS